MSTSPNNDSVAVTTAWGAFLASATIIAVILAVVGWVLFLTPIGPILILALAWWRLVSAADASSSAEQLFQAPEWLQLLPLIAFAGLGFVVIRLGFLLWTRLTRP